MTAPDELPAEIESLVLAETVKRVTARDKLNRAVFGQHYQDGQKETFRSPIDGARIGSVWRTDPDFKWVVTDRAAFEAEMRTFPGNLVTDVGIAPEDMPEALAVLAEHAPHLITETSRLADGVEAAALAQAKDTGTAVAAGIECVKPAGTLTVKVDPKTGAAAIERLVSAGRIGWDGRPALPAADESGAA
jgi:hypothetical protein